MRSIMSALVVLVMIFAVVSAAVYVQASNAPVNAARDADRPGNFLAGSPYPCIDSPGYTDYIDARAVACPIDRKQTPDPMGSW